MVIPDGLRCPKCGSADIAEIIYGPVEMTDELLLQVQAKKVLIRNEHKPNNPPRYYCYYCGYEW
jgi:hypothetical protein